MKNVFIKGLAKLVLLTMILTGTMVTVPTAFAVAGLGTATINIGTGGTNASNTTFAGAAASGAVTVGTLSYVKLDLTLGAGGINDAEANVTVQINTNLFPTNGWDNVGPEIGVADLNTVGEWILTYTDTDVGTTNNAGISFALSTATNTGLITIQADQQMDATDIISIYGVVNDTSYTRAPASVVILTDDTGANSLTAIGAPPTIATSAAASAATNATVTLATPTVGATQNTSVNFTIPRALVSGDTVEFTLPSSLYVAGLDTTDAAQSFGDVGTFDCTATQLMVCTADGAVTAGTGIITLAGITGRYILAAQTLTDFQVESLGAVANDIAVDTSVAVDAVTTAQASGTTVATVTVANAAVGTTQNTSINFTIPVPLISGDTVEFTLPANFDVTGLDTTDAAQSFTGAGTFDCTAANAMVCTADGVVNAGTGIITLVGTSGGYIADATTLTDFQVEYQGVPAQDIAVDTSVAVPATTVGALSAASITLSDMTASQYNTHTIVFTTTATIPNLGKIKITYPSGWNLSGANSTRATALSGLDGTWTATVSGQDLTLIQTGGTATAVGVKSLQIQGGIQTPSSPGAGGNITILTQLAAGTSIQTVGSISTGTVIAGSNSSSWDSSNTSTNSTTTTTTTTTTTDTTATATDESAATDTTEETAEAVEETVVTTESGETVTLTDVSDHWGATEIEAMVEQGIVKGDETTETFRPDENLNRAEAATLLYRVFGLDDPAETDIKPFSDVELDQWYAKYIWFLKFKEIVKGNPDGTYKPGNNMNRAEFLELAMKTYYSLVDETKQAEIDALKAGAATNSYADLDKTQWYAPTVTAATSLEFIGGKTCGEAKCFDAGANITRAEATKILYNMFYEMLIAEPAE